MTWFAFWGTLGLNLIHHFVGAPDIHDHVAARVLGILASQVAMFTVLLIARATVLRHTAVTPRPVATFICFALAGLVRALVVLAMLSTIGDLTASQVAQRLIGGPIPFAAYLAVCAYLVDLYQQNRRALVQAAAVQSDLLAARAHAETALRWQGVQAIDEVREEFARRLDTAGSDLTAEQLDAFIDNTLRPISHRLADRVQRWSPPATRDASPKMSVAGHSG